MPTPRKSVFSFRAPNLEKLTTATSREHQRTRTASLRRTLRHTPTYRTHLSASYPGHQPPNPRTMAYFRITLMRSGIGMPKKVQGVLHALGLKKRMTTVYYPVSQSVAGQIMRIKELVDVKEVEKPMSKEEMRAARRPDKGYYVEKRAEQVEL
ncbi:hypothetical protein DPSP01_004441 [Paraphaeosphaeria sporulosa]